MGVKHSLNEARSNENIFIRLLMILELPYAQKNELDWLLPSGVFNMSTRVKKHKRNKPSGGKTTVKSHIRKRGRRPVPVRTNNPTVEGFAIYDEANDRTHLAVTDTDKNRLTTVTQNEPFEAVEVIVEEQPAALNIVVEGKKKKRKGITKQEASRTVINVTDLF